MQLCIILCLHNFNLYEINVNWITYVFVRWYKLWIYIIKYIDYKLHFDNSFVFNISVTNIFNLIFIQGLKKYFGCGLEMKIIYIFLIYLTF